MAETDNLYGYTPTRSVCYIFLILFAITTLAHTWQAVRSRAWWLLPTVVIAGLAEVVGWGARTKSSYDATARLPFIIQITVLVLAPTPLVAALFIGFGRVTARLGEQYSRLSPALFQRYSDRPFKKAAYDDQGERHALDRHMKMLIAGICISTILIYIRSIYRIIEFADGFNGTIAHTQVLFNVFDGMLVTLAMYTLNFMHPGRLLLATKPAQSYALAGRTSSY